MHLQKGRGNELQFKSQLKGLNYLSTYLFRVSLDLDVWVGLDFTVLQISRVAVLTVNDVSGGWCLTVSVMAFTVQVWDNERSWRTRRDGFERPDRKAVR